MQTPNGPNFNSADPALRDGLHPYSVYNLMSPCKTECRQPQAEDIIRVAGYRLTLKSDIFGVETCASPVRQVTAMPHSARENYFDLVLGVEQAVFPTNSFACSNSSPHNSTLAIAFQARTPIPSFVVKAPPVKFVGPARRVRAFYTTLFLSSPSHLGQAPAIRCTTPCGVAR